MMSSIYGQQRQNVHYFLFILYLLSFQVAQIQAQKKTFSPSIKSLQVIANEDALAPACIRLHTEEFVEIQFDQLKEEATWMNYRVIHCNLDGTDSNISDLDYIDGFNDIEVEDYAPSFNTFVPYYNYRLTLPNDRIQLKISGNYRVEFYDSDNPDQVLAQAYFQVSEAAARIGAEVRTNTDMGFNSGYQQVDLRVNWNRININNPASDLKVLVRQNNRTDNQVLLTTPSRMNTHEVEYSFNRNLVFEAGNNYRRFEITDHQYATMGVEQVRHIEDKYHVLLIPDEVLKNKPYFYDQDQNGRFFIREVRAEDHSLEADYMQVYFSLPMEYPLLQGAIHLQGDMLPNGYNLESEMIYNNESKAYEKALLLKQGLYNYQYHVVDQNKKGSTALIEGNHYEAENEYYIQVYFRAPGQRYDRLIACHLIRKM